MQVSWKTQSHVQFIPGQLFKNHYTHFKLNLWRDRSHFSKLILKFIRTFVATFKLRTLFCIYFLIFPLKQNLTTYSSKTAFCTFSTHN